MVVHEQDPHAALIGSAASADKSFMRHEERDDYQAWLWSTVLLIGLLGAALALFVAYPSLRNTYELPQARLVLDTAVMLAAAIVALLAGIRFSVEGRRLDRKPPLTSPTSRATRTDRIPPSIPPSPRKRRKRIAEARSSVPINTVPATSLGHVARAKSQPEQIISAFAA